MKYLDLRSLLIHFYTEYCLTLGSDPNVVNLSPEH